MNRFKYAHLLMTISC